jgi:hypothetical protein
MIESTITKIEYLTSRQVTSCENGDLAKRNLNLLPVRAKATFCQPFRISLRIKINKRKMTAIFKPVKFSIIPFVYYEWTNLTKPNRSFRRVLSHFSGVSYNLRTQWTWLKSVRTSHCPSSSRGEGLFLARITSPPLSPPLPICGEGEDRRCICIGGEVEKNQHLI